MTINLSICKINHSLQGSLWCTLNLSTSKINHSLLYRAKVTQQANKSRLNKQKQIDKPFTSLCYLILIIKHTTINFSIAFLISQQANKGKLNSNKLTQKQIYKAFIEPWATSHSDNPSSGLSLLISKDRHPNRCSKSVGGKSDQSRMPKMPQLRMYCNQIPSCTLTKKITLVNVINKRAWLCVRFVVCMHDLHGGWLVTFYGTN